MRSFISKILEISVRGTIISSATQKEEVSSAIDNNIFLIQNSVV
jgi:hypothetical protein